MKRYIQFLICIAIILSIACTVKEYYFSQQSTSSASFQNDAHSHLHKTIDNSEQSWYMLLINDWNCLPEDFNVSLHETENGEKVDERIYPYLEEMLLDAERNGHSPEITSGYRSEKEQQELFDNRMDEYIALGYSKKEAKKLTNEYAAKPGYSEHETGLAVDINSSTGDSWELYGWLSENCYRYGFILRYPDGKTEITGIEYEPWHLRFVGEEAAKYIHENDITLEEYIINKTDN